MRRVLIALASIVVFPLLAVSLGTAAAQSAGEVPRVGYISPGSSSDPVRVRRFEAFRQGLRELGYVEGLNIALEPRWAGGHDRYPTLVADLVQRKVGVIVAVGGAATKAAKQVTRTIVLWESTRARRPAGPSPDAYGATVPCLSGGATV